MPQKFNPKNRDLIVNINGQLVHRDEAGISPFDSAVQGGDAVWEGLRLYNGRIFKLHEHLDRLERSARALSIVDLNHAGKFAHCAGAKHFVSTINVDQRQIGFDAADFFGGGDLDHSCASNSFRTRNDFTRGQVAFTHDENVGRVGFGNEPADVEHQRVIRVCVVRLNFGQNRIEQVGVMDSGIENF